MIVEPEETKIENLRINPEDIFKKAKFYVDKLNFSVIPIAYKTKKPICKWKEFQTRPPTIDKIKEWFSTKPLNIGLVTGRISRLIVIDVDDPSQTPEWLKDVKTWIAKTNRGYHYYFRINKDEYIPTMYISSAVQLKAEGSYVLLPESVHPSGIIYKWKTFIKTLSEPAHFDVIRDKICEVIKNNQNVNNQKPLRELYFGVNEGERNISLTRIAGSLLSDGLTLNEIYEVLRVINERNNPPLPEKEVKTIIKSISKRNRKIIDKENKIASYLSRKIIKHMTRDLLGAFESAINEFESFKQELSEKDRLYVEREFGKIIFSKLVKAVKFYSLTKK